MNRITHDCRQGSNEWMQLRAKYFTASELSAAAGKSKYQSRTDLVKQKATGIVPEVDAAKQRLFDAGHAAEAAARPIVESILGTELYPVTMSCEVDGLPLLASLDGIDMLGDMIWENKLLNASLKADIEAGKIDLHYAYQIEQQLLVSGAEKCYFTASDGTAEGTFGMWYESNHELRQEIVSIWTQFEKDVAAYVPEESKAAVVAEKVEGLPALFVQVEGRVVASNMDAFKSAAESFISRLPKADQLQTDQDFVNADQAAKDCKDAEDKLQVVKAQAQSQAVSIDEAFRAIDHISERIRSARLALEKVVKAEKENRKAEIVTTANRELSAHIAALQGRVGIMVNVAGNFADAIKGLKSLDSMRDKVSVALANAKVEANAIADRIEANRKTVEDMSLFPDFAQVCTKAPEDFAALQAMRVAQRKEAEEKRLEAEREKIRAQEQAKAKREAAEKAAAEKREADAKAEAEQAERDRIAAEEIRKIDAARKEAEANQETASQEFGGKTMSLGQINEALGVVSVTAAQLGLIGILPVRQERAAKLYDANDLPTICRLIQEHLAKVMQQGFRMAA